MLCCIPPAARPLELIAALFDSHNSTKCAAMWFRHIPEAVLSREYTPSASPFEMLLLGFKAVWRTEQNSTVAGTEHSCVWWSQGLRLYITQQYFELNAYISIQMMTMLTMLIRYNVNLLVAQKEKSGSSKLLGFSLWAPNTVSNFMAIHSVVSGIFQSEPKWWTDWPTLLWHFWWQPGWKT